MKLLLAILLGFIVVFDATKAQKSGYCPEIIREECKENHKKCLEETGANENDLDKVRMGNFVEDEAVKTFLVCVFRNFNLITEDNKLNVTAAWAWVPADQQERHKIYITKCGYVDNGNLFDDLYKTLQCYHREDPEVYFIV